MLRLIILYRAGGRILIDGGTYPLETTAKASSTSVVQQRAEAIYSAFSRFRDQHRLPSVPQFRRTSSRTRLNAMTGAAPSPAPFLPLPSPSGLSFDLLAELV